MRTPLQQSVLVAIVLLNAYCFGANCVERFVNYHTWNLIPAEAFQAYHKRQQPLILAFVVAPMSIAFALQLWSTFRVPAGVEPLVLWVMIVTSAAGAISTVMLQLPIHAAFNRNGYSPELMRTLLRTDWIRKGADAIRLAATAELLHRLLNAR